MKSFFASTAILTIFLVAAVAAHAATGHYVVRLKSVDAGRLSPESVGRLLGGIVKARASDPRVLLLEKDKALPEKTS